MTPQHVGTSYTHNFRFNNKENASGNQINGGHLPLKFPLSLCFGQRAAQKTIKYFSHFNGLVADNQLQSFVRLGTHSEPCRCGNQNEFYKELISVVSE